MIKIPASPRLARPSPALPCQALPRLAVLIISLVALDVKSAVASPSQLPPGEQCFQIATGPVSSGSIAMYFPNTTTPKATWQDQNQTVQNNTPIQLDANGCAIIWGIGSYRQQLWTGPVVGGAPSGNLVFDLTVQDISSQFNLVWGGQAVGSVNNIQLQLQSWQPTAGFNIQFIPIGANTGPVTLSPNTGVTPISVLKDTNTGPVGLTGGELGPGDVANLVYDATAAIFHLQNPLSSGGNQGVPIGAEVSCAGFAAPTGFLFEFGQAVSRSTFASLLSQLTSIQNATLANTVTVTGLTSTEQLAPGMPVEGAGIPGGATIATIASGTSVTLSIAATITGASSLTFFAYGNGDGSTTFNLPDRRGRTLVGRNNMGGSNSTVLTSTFTTVTPNALGRNLVSPSGTAGGGISIAQGNLPAVTLSVNIPGGQGAHTHTFPVFTNTGVTNSVTTASGTTSGVGTATTASQSLGAMFGSTTAMGSNVAISPMMPSQTVNSCIRVQ